MNNNENFYVVDIENEAFFEEYCNCHSCKNCIYKNSDGYSCAYVDDSLYSDDFQEKN